MTNIFRDTRLQLAVLVLVALLLRVGQLSSSLSYDEIWTLQNYSELPLSQIFTDLELPNNQPLNTVAVKILAFLLPIPAVVRLHSLLAGVGSVVLLWFIALVASGRRAAFWSGLFLALSAPAALYSQLARGYELQLFFLLLCFAGFAMTGQYRPRRWKFLPEILIAAGGAGALFTLPTTVIFLAAGVLVLWLRRPQRPGRGVTVVVAAGAVITLGYLLINFQAFQTGRQWGSAITSVADWFRFAGGTMEALLPPLLILPVLVGTLRRPPARGFDRGNAALLLFVVLTLLSALATKAGPPRVYLPLTAIFSLLAGIGVDRIFDWIAVTPAGGKWLRAAVTVIVLLAAATGYFTLARNPAWRLPDWRRVFAAVAADYPPETLVVYRATDGYPVMWNNAPEIYDDHFARLANRADRRMLLMFDEPGAFNGSNREMGEEVRNFPAVPESQAAPGGVPASLYRLERLREPPSPGLPVIAVIGPVQETAATTLANEVDPGGPVQLNIWLNTVTREQNGVSVRGLLLLLPPEAVTAETLARLSRYGDAVALYQVR